MYGLVGRLIIWGAAAVGFHTMYTEFQRRTASKYADDHAEPVSFDDQT